MASKDILTVDGLLALVNEIQPEENESQRDFLARMEREAKKADGLKGNALIDANRHRTRIGLALMNEWANRRNDPDIKGLSKIEWELKRAKDLGLGKDRSIRTYLGIAKALTKVVQARNDGTLAKPLPKAPSPFDCNLTRVAAALSNLATYGDPTWKRPKPPVNDDAVFARLLKQTRAAFCKAQTLNATNAKRQFVLEVHAWAEARQREAIEVDLRFVKGRPRRSVLVGITPYPGGKSRQIDALLAMLGHPARLYLTYVEPFTGGGSVLLNAIQRDQVKRIWINDGDISTAAMWNAILHFPGKLQDRIEEQGRLTPKAVTKSVGIVGAQDPKMDVVELGFHALVARRGSYSGYAGATGRDTLPQESLDQKWRFTIEPEVDETGTARRVPGVCSDVRRAHFLLSQCDIWRGECTSMDAVQLIRNVPMDSVMFLDPPYVERGVTKGKNCYHRELDHQALADALLSSSVPWVMTYDDCDEVRRLYGINDGRAVRAEVKGPLSDEQKEEVNVIHDFVRAPPGDGSRNAAMLHGGQVWAHSAMVEYVGHGEKHNWKPDLRIGYRPLWQMTNSALMELGGVPWTTVTDSGKRESAVRFTVDGDRRTFNVQNLPGTWQEVLLEDNPDVPEFARQEARRERLEQEQYERECDEAATEAPESRTSTDRGS